MQIEKKDNNLLLKFDYNKSIVNDLKKIYHKQRSYDIDQRLWTVEITESNKFVILDIIIKSIDKLDVLSDETIEWLEQVIAEKEDREKVFVMSNAAYSSFKVTGLKRTLRPFQAAGVEYGIKSQRCFIADDQGLGKTTEAIAIIHSLQSYPALVITPASVKFNWEKEINETLQEPPVISVVPEQIRDTSSIFIINYDQVGKFEDILKDIPFESVIIDESHNLKGGSKTVRFKSILKVTKNIKYKFLLSGTPIVNRVHEIIPQLQLLDRLDDFGGFHKFIYRYCDAKKTRFGLDISGCSRFWML
jgi:SWI/SNF-related matrix-associated actin-dependent regulator of chromatin subfamily A-like protein 1